MEHKSKTAQCLGIIYGMAMRYNLAGGRREVAPQSTHTTLQLSAGGGGKLAGGEVYIYPCTLFFYFFNFTGTR